MMTTQSWAQQRKALARNFRCVLHDFRGQLRSPFQGPIDMSVHVTDLAELMDRLHIDAAHLVGTSYGGEVGMMFAGAHPERVRSLSVIASTARADESIRQPVRRWADAARSQPHLLWEIALPYNYSPEFIAYNPVFVEAARQRFASLPPEWYSSLAELCVAFERLDVDLSNIKCPTLVVAAENDRLKPLPYSRQIAEDVTNARLVVISDSGHAVVIEKPTEVNDALLTFLISSQ